MDRCPYCGAAPEPEPLDENPEWRRIDSHVTVDRDPMAEQEEDRRREEMERTKPEAFGAALLRRRRFLP